MQLFDISFDSQVEYTTRPLLFYHHGHMMLQYSRRLFTGYKAFRNERASSSLSQNQLDAMDSLEFLAQRCSHSMTLKKGDIQWVNNLGVLHSRDKYYDDKDNMYVNENEQLNIN